MNENKKNLPNFLIVGAAKAGTTSLYHYLKQHPQIYLNDEIKESFFLTGLNNQYVNPECGSYCFNKRINDAKKYEALFKNTNGAKSIGEICVGYLYFYEESIPNIKKYLGDPKIIIILRDPVERAYSNYLHHVRDGYEKKSFEEALALESERENRNFWWGYQFRKAGLYYESVKAYLHNFTNVKIFLFDDLRNNLSAMLKDILSFLEVNTQITSIKMSEKYNVTGTPKNNRLHNFLRNHGTVIPYPLVRVIKKIISKQTRDKIITHIHNTNLRKDPMKKTTRVYLQNYYKEDINQLQNIIEQDISHWLNNQYEENV